MPQHDATSGFTRRVRRTNFAAGTRLTAPKNGFMTERSQQIGVRFAIDISPAMLICATQHSFTGKSLPTQ